MRAIVFGLALLAGCGNAPPPETKAPASPPEPAKPAPSGITETKADDPPPKPAASADASQKVDVKNANGFTLRVLAKSKTTTSSNTMISGTSLRQALGAAYLGAKGSTKQEMAQALALPDDRDKAADAAKAENAAWEEARGKSAELVVANRVWVDKGTALDPEYGALAQSIGFAPAFVEIQKKPEEARKAINSWVSEQTKEKIHDLLPSGSLDARTKLVITNAIYFKGRWANPFPKSATKDEPFTTATKQTVNVPTMHLIDSFRYGEDKNVKVLELRYEGSDLALMIVLPDTKDGLAKVEESLDADAIERWSGALQSTRVDVALPKLSFRSGGVMNPVLQELGIKTAFSDKADFGAMADPKAKIQIGPVFHQTFLTVDEVGTEAAAATGAVMRTTSLMVGEPKPFKVDHPFLFFVRDAKRGRLLFAGRVVDPKMTAP